MADKEYITRLLPRIGLSPRAYKLLPAEYAMTKSLDNCPIEHSHFIAEYCRLPGDTIELLLRYSKLFDDKPIEVCAGEIGLVYNGSWREPTVDKDSWLEKLPPVVKRIQKDIKSDIIDWHSNQS